MNSTQAYISYSSTKSFSKIVLDYIEGHNDLKPFYNNEVSIEGIKKAIAERKNYATDRKLLVEVLQHQYQQKHLTATQEENIKKLSLENTFTITTAHQPNLFTGHLYFVYKILHAIKLANHLQKEIPQNNFVPIYYMGSEDADLQELNHIYIDGKNYEWQTKQTGAVGRMKVDKALVALIDEIAAQLLVQPFGKQVIELLKSNYKEHETIEQATFNLVNQLFAEYGLLIVLPDNALLKKSFTTVLKKEIEEGFSAKAVEQTVAAFPKQYKVQASGRATNLFYLQDDIRERLEKQNDVWKVVNTTIEFTEDELLHEIDNYPERFSPNVILRPIFQEMILPNVAFIGGGGEIGYWLELKKVFEAANVPYPVLVLRNSYLIIEEKNKTIIEKLQLSNEDIFCSDNELLNAYTKKHSDEKKYSLQDEKNNLINLYQQIQSAGKAIDKSLTKHVEALKVKAINKIDALEKKLFKAQKKKFEVEKNQIEKIKASLFPQNNLQERVENILPYYAKYGNVIIEKLYEVALPMESKFTLLEI